LPRESRISRAPTASIADTGNSVGGFRVVRGDCARSRSYRLTASALPVRSTHGASRSPPMSKMQDSRMPLPALAGGLTPTRPNSPAFSTSDGSGRPGPRSVERAQLEGVEVGWGVGTQERERGEALLGEVLELQLGVLGATHESRAVATCHERGLQGEQRGERSIRIV